jgi:predicted transcriptional regulator
MAHEWIFEVLQDMRNYSQKNGLPALMEQLDLALRVAKTEIASGEGVRDEDTSEPDSD